MPLLTPCPSCGRLYHRVRVAVEDPDGGPPRLVEVLVQPVPFHALRPHVAQSDRVPALVRPDGTPASKPPTPDALYREVFERERPLTVTPGQYLVEHAMVCPGKARERRLPAAPLLLDSRQLREHHEAQERRQAPAATTGDKLRAVN